MDRRDALVSHARGRVAVLSVMGNAHFATFLLARKPLFDFFDPNDPGHPVYPSAVIVPRRMVKALPMLNTRWLRDLIMKLHSGGCRHVVVAGTPPVRENFGDSKEVRESTFWRERANAMNLDLTTCALTPAPIMKRLWGVLQESLSEVAREAGARFLPVPKEGIDVNGYLPIQYQPPLTNITHANDAYGRLMLNHIVNAVREATI